MLDPLLDLPSAVPIQTDTKGIKEALTCVEKKKAMRLIPEIIRATTQENHVQTTFCLGACWLCAWVVPFCLFWDWAGRATCDVSQRP